MSMPLPVHPLTGATAVGWRKPRPGEDPDRLYPIWPVLGGAKDDSGDDDGQGDDADDNDNDDAGGDDDAGDGQGDDADDGADDDDADPEGADHLGDPGKRALASMKGKWRSERDKRRALEKQVADSAAGDKAAAERRQIEQDALAKANVRIVRAEVRAAAARKLADPADALKFLDLDQFEVDDDGNLDSEEVAEAIEELIKNKPYLAAATAKRFQGTGDGGAARKASRPKQLTENDLKTMSAEQIVKAQDEGRLDDLLGAG
ncbi:hypothetical protein [Streptomyces sp. NPDC019937]|uniref:hypothetical protein n=1 Tax=Streptomyces sp. NPDC019937 TaxID=3154787 RepID=UPI0034117BFF